MNTKNTAQANTLRPYYVTITETLSRSVIIWADSSEAADEKAADLCNSGEIDLTAADFANREIQCDGVARESDLPTLPPLRQGGNRMNSQNSSTAHPVVNVIVCIKGGLVQSAYANAHGVTVNFDVIDLDTSNSPDDAELDEQGKNLEMIARVEHDPNWKAIY